VEDDNKKRMEEQRKRLQADSQKRMFFKQVLDDKAFERSANIRMASPELYDQLYSVLSYLMQNGQLSGKVSEEKMLALLRKMKETKREPTISFSRK